MTKVKPVFQPGRIIGGCLIQECYNPTAPISQRLYAVVYDCCDKRAEITHKRLRDRETLGMTRCGGCQRREVAKQQLAASAARKAAAAEQAKAAQAAADRQAKAADRNQPGGLAPLDPPRTQIDANGHPWPHLGRLGPRWSVGTTKPNRLATGKEPRG